MRRGGRQGTKALDLLGVQKTPLLARGVYLREARHISLWGLVAGVVEGNLAAVVVAKTFGGGELLVNIAATTSVAAHLTSLLWGVLCTGRRKLHVMAGCACGVIACLAGIALTPRTTMGGWLFVALMAFAQFFMTGVVTVRTALWKNNYPAQHRGQIAARLQMIRMTTGTLGVSLIAALFDRHPEAYRWIYPAVAGLGLAAVLLLRKLRIRGEGSELARQGRNGSPGGAAIRRALAQVLSPGRLLREGVRVLQRDRRFRFYCIAQMLSGCGNLLVRTVQVVVIAELLVEGIPQAYWISAAVLEVMPKLVVIISMPRFARYYDRVGVVRFRAVHGWCWTSAIAVGGIGTVLLVYRAAVGPWAEPIALGVFGLYALLRGMCEGGGAIAWYLGHLHFARSEEAEVYMGIHVSLTGLRGLVMPTIGVILWATIGWGVWLVSVVFSAAAVLSFGLLDRLERAGLEAERSGEAGAALPPAVATFDAGGSRG
jgi:hypothetical protein